MPVYHRSTTVKSSSLGCHYVAPISNVDGLKARLVRISLISQSLRSSLRAFADKGVDDPSTSISQITALSPVELNA